MTRIHTLLGTCVTLLVTSTVPALAQGPTITSPAPNQVFRAGPDYATDVLHDPWDFSNVDDVGQYPYEYLGWAQSANAFLVGPSAFSVGSGKFIATNASSDPGIGLLYPGGIHTPNPGRNGQRYPVSTSLYRKLAFRLKATGAGGSPAAVHWYPAGVGSPVSPGSAFAPVPVSNGERIYQIDLVANHASGPQFDSQANMVGLRLDPINDGSPASIELDWVRLTAPDGSPDVTMNVSANNCSGAVSLEVIDGGALATVVDTSLPLSFNYGIFPPGNYQLRLTCNGSPSPVVPFTINDPPQVTVLQPDERGGVDYATTVLNNAWNFDHPNDVPAFNNVEFLSAAPGQLHARNAGPSLGDTQLFLLNGEGGARPIATSRYRYLTFSLGLNAPFSLSSTDGSVARVFWGSDPLGFDGNRQTTTQDILIWPGFRSYTIDLSSLSVAGGTLEPCAGPCIPWTARSVRFFRFDPLEFGTQQVDFVLGTVTLAAPDEVVQGQSFPIQWSVSGVSAGTVNLYYDNDTNPTNGLQPIASGLSATSYNWPVGSLAPGDYYIYVQVNEATAAGTDTRGAYSTGVLRVIAAANSPVVTIATHASGSSTNAPFTIGGCAFNAATGAAADEVLVYAHPLQGQMGGVVQRLGHNAAGGLGTQAAAACASGPGYQVTNVFGLPQGLWTLRVLARNPVTGDFDEVQAQNVSIALTAGAPGNFRASISGNTVSLAWDPPGGEVTQYRIEAANNPGFAGFSWAVLPPSQTSITATLGNGTYYLRVRAGNPYSNDGPPSNVLNFTLPGGGPVAAPGAITLSGQVNANPVSLHWSQAGGGAATYALHAGSAPGASNIAIVPMGTATGLPPVVVPTGVSIFARIVASNAAGSTVSNEVVVNVPAPGPPGGPPIQLDPIVADHTVTIRWNPPAGGATPTSYAIVGRVAGSPAVIAVVPGLTSTSFSAPGVPSGNFVTTIVAMYGLTPSIESNPKAVNVP